MRKFTPMHKLNLSKALTGKRKPKEIKEKIALAMRTVIVQENTRKKHQSQALYRSKITKQLEQHIANAHPKIKCRLDRRRLQTQCHACSFSIKTRVHPFLSTDH